MPFVTVGVVSLYFPPDPTGSFPTLRGFGYLIPQAVPFEQNPELALGVIFDSCAVKGQDTVDGTKLTVMLGGHYWKDWASPPSGEECVAMARSVLERHLGITAEPAAVHARVHQRAIPQYRVGHRKRLGQLHEHLIDTYGGRVKVAGGSYTGVGVNDCIRAAYYIAESALSPRWRDFSGLESFTAPREFGSLKVREKS